MRKLRVPQVLGRIEDAMNDRSMVVIDGENLYVHEDHAGTFIVNTLNATSELLVNALSPIAEGIYVLALAGEGADVESLARLTCTTTEALDGLYHRMVKVYVEAASGETVGIAPLIHELMFLEAVLAGEPEDDKAEPADEADEAVVESESSDEVEVVESSDGVAVGGPEMCVCSECDYRIVKARGVPCRSMSCTKCGATLVAGVKEDGVVTSSAEM